MSEATDCGGFNDGLLDFLSRATSPYHAAATLAEELVTAGFRAAPDSPDWEPAPGERVFLRHGGSLIALRCGSGAPQDTGLRMLGAHTDSPCLMVKPQPELSEQGYCQLGVEVYGGALLHPWFDRDLSLAGRVSFERAGGVATALVDFRDPVAVVPSLAIHLDREANSGRAVNPQLEMAPLLGIAGAGEFDLRRLLADRLREGGTAVDAVLDYELCLYDTQAPALVGLDREFIASARLDNLLSCYTGLRALLDAGGDEWALLVCNDHEEVGSQSATGAQGPMLREFLRRLPARDTGSVP
jgi:aspartyl aminopeptidase